MKWQKMVSILSRLPVSTVILQPMQTIKVICFSYGRFEIFKAFVFLPLQYPARNNFPGIQFTQQLVVHQSKQRPLP